MEGATSGVTIATCLESIVDAAKVGLDFISDNAILMTVFAGGILTTLAFRFIRKAKKAAK